MDISKSNNLVWNKDESNQYYSLMTGITKFHKNLKVNVNYLDESVQFSKLHLQITPNFTVTVIMLQYTSGRRKHETRQCVCNIALRCIHVTTVAMEKQYLLNNMNVCLYTCLLPRMQSASFLHSIILSSVACLALSYFSTLPHNGMIF